MERHISCLGEVRRGLYLNGAEGEGGVRMDLLERVGKGMELAVASVIRGGKREDRGM